MQSLNYALQGCRQFEVVKINAIQTKHFWGVSITKEKLKPQKNENMSARSESNRLCLVQSFKKKATLSSHQTFSFSHVKISMFNASNYNLVTEFVSTWIGSGWIVKFLK